MTTRPAKRLLNDTRAAQEPELRAQGVYYLFDESDIRKGFVLMRGHSGTPYEGLLGRFDFVFPDDYPFSPPQVLWRTHDGMTRFHPQLYKGGKVCLSILGTWSGPGWASCMNLSSVLQILQSLFVENPLACEPGFEKGTLQDAQFRAYKEYLEYRVADYMIRNLIAWKQNPLRSIWAYFADELKELYPSLVSFWKTKIQQRSEQPEQVFQGTAFVEPCETRWKHLRELLPKLESPT
jgi:ubiquitin-protein ligase